MNLVPSTLADIDWQQALQNDRIHTLERVYVKVYPMALHYVKTNGGSADDAKDIFQEAMLVFYEKVVHDQLILTASMSTYLMAICKNLWRQELEKRTRKIPLTDKQVDGFWEETDTETLPSMQLTDFVSELGEKCKDILVSFYYFGQRLEQIAARHHYSNIRTATVQKFKCLERLRKAVSHLSIERFQ